MDFSFLGRPEFWVIVFFQLRLQSRQTPLSSIRQLHCASRLSCLQDVGTGVANNCQGSGKEVVLFPSFVPRSVLHLLQTSRKEVVGQTTEVNRICPCPSDCLLPLPMRIVLESCVADQGQL